ncbi:MAG: mechanosensitive ion channel family protein [Anaerolineae bacterium]|nr:mechanosensitive ion channel family protein [Anaerolineae bacterium]
MDILERTLWGNTLATWLLALAVAVLAFLVLGALKRILSRGMLAWVKKTETDLDDLVVNLFGRTWYLFLVAVSIAAGSLVLTLPAVESGIHTVLVILFWVQAALWGSGVIDYLVSRPAKEQAEEDRSAATTVNMLGYVGKGILWTVAVLLALDNIPGVEVTALIASLGVGGIAVALAVQNILGDLFASLSIVLDKPFVIGDSITVGEYVGTVEHIGLKSTRVRSLTGEQLVFSNSDLLSSRIRNYGRMDERRALFTLGVTCQTPYDKLVEIPGIVQEIIEAQPQTRFGRAHFKAYGDFSLDFEIVYYMVTSDYSVFMDVQQAINLEIFRRFAEEGIELAYPTQTVFVTK